VLDRTTADRLLAGILLRGTVLYSQKLQPKGSRAAPRRRTRARTPDGPGRNRACPPTAGVEILQQRPDRVAYGLAFSSERTVGDIGAAETPALGALDQVDQRALPFALDDASIDHFADRPLGCGRYVRSAEDDGASHRRFTARATSTAQRWVTL
jgi:hypothetical protein